MHHPVSWQARAAVRACALLTKLRDRYAVARLHVLRGVVHRPGLDHPHYRDRISTRGHYPDSGHGRSLGVGPGDAYPKLLIAIRDFEPDPNPSKRAACLVLNRDLPADQVPTAEGW